MSHTRVYEIVTDRICALLEAGTVPWQQPWIAEVGQPRNLVSKKAYRGINVFLLGSMRYPSPWWLSFPRQVNALGGSLRRGEHTTIVIFWTQWEKKDEGDEKAHVVPLLRYYRVVNAAQCTGLDVPPAESIERQHTPIEACEQLVANMPNPPQVRDGDRASYSPSKDVVTMPRAALFLDGERYYSTLFHELSHSTGHPARLNRLTLVDMVPFGSPGYSKEELVAEMGAAYLCALSGIDNAGVIGQSASYIKGWLSRLRDDVKLVVLAAAQAQRAVDYITHAYAPLETVEA